MSAAVPSEAPEVRALLGEVVVQSAADRSAVVARALDLLAVRAEDRVLEVGCGRGDILFQIAARARRGFAAGIDVSELMLQHARFRNRPWIARRRAEVRRADSADLAVYEDGGFDQVLGVNVVYFWDEPRRHLRELRRVLRPGGHLVLGFRPDEGPAPLGDAARRARVAVDRAAAWLHEAGFDAVRALRECDGQPPFAWLSARG